MKQTVSGHAQMERNRAFLLRIQNDMHQQSKDYYNIPLQTVKMKKKTIRTMDMSAKPYKVHMKELAKVEERKRALEAEKKRLFDQLK